MNSLKWNDVNRLTVNQLNSIKNTYENREEKSPFGTRIKAIINHYLPQIEERSVLYNEIYNNSIKYNPESLVVSKELSASKSAHYLNVRISCNIFSINLDELHSNCGILLSHKTDVFNQRYGIGTILHAIKEDIAYMTGYSVLMFSDKIEDDRPGNKLLEKTGAKLLYKTVNKRNSNTIGMWIKNITEIYNERRINEESKETVKLEEEITF